VRTNGRLSPGKQKMTAEIRVYCHPDLKNLIGDMADKADLSLSEYVVRVLADHAKRPALREVPRKRSGRPREPINV
jgi:hypothetical protein